MNPVLEGLIWLGAGFLFGSVTQPYLGEYSSIICVVASLALFAWIKKGTSQDATEEVAVPTYTTHKRVKPKRSAQVRAGPIRPVATQQPIETVLSPAVLEAAQRLAVIGEKPWRPIQQR